MPANMYCFCVLLISSSLFVDRSETARVRPSTATTVKTVGDVAACFRTNFQSCQNKCASAKFPRSKSADILKCFEDDSDTDTRMKSCLDNAGITDQSPYVEKKLPKLQVFESCFSKSQDVVTSKKAKQSNTTPANGTKTPFTSTKKSKQNEISPQNHHQQQQIPPAVPIPENGENLVTVDLPPFVTTTRAFFDCHRDCIVQKKACDDGCAPANATTASIAGTCWARVQQQIFETQQLQPHQQRDPIECVREKMQ